MKKTKAHELKQESAVKVFDLAVKGMVLPTKVDDLVPLSFIGQTAVNYYRDKIKLMDELGMTEAQREATLKDGQQAGELLLDIETRIGEIALKERQSAAVPLGPKAGFKPSGKPPKHERLGLKEKHMEQAQKIAQNPDVVARVKAKAKANEDIPTKTAVLAEISYEREKKRRKAAEGKREKVKLEVAIEQSEYLSAQDDAVGLLNKVDKLLSNPPKEWDEAALVEAKAKAKIITNRLDKLKKKLKVFKDA